MPIMRCTLPNGKQGWKFGENGKCVSTRSHAIEIMRAIKVSQSKGEDLMEQVDKTISEKNQENK